MSYVALARKWRPKRFAEMIGQEHVRRALTNALAGDRVHHAFLFTGTRGVGKTTVARILAKCLNCELGVGAEPCGECRSCREIDEGRFVDLIEVDAASRTKVDDTRELLDNVQYAPTRGRCKVYLIDEVHMLSTSSFNALLKTLEEPPPHVKFLLATTDPQKLPVTVLSRCLQFNLKRLPLALIAERMQHILEAEQIPYEPAGVRLVAQAADGSVRDGLSLLDQLIAFGGGRVGESEARAMLGTVARDHVLGLADRLAKLDAAELMRYARELEEWAPDHAQLLDELAGLLTRVALRQAVPDLGPDELYPDEVVSRLARELSAEDTQLLYQIAILGRRDLPLAPDPRTGFEMTLLRMVAFRPTGTGEGASVESRASEGRAVDAPAAAAVSGGGGPGRPYATERAEPAVRSARSAPRPSSALPASTQPGSARQEPSPPFSAQPSSMQPPPVQREGRPTGASPDSPQSGSSWGAILAQLDVQGAARQLASHCSLLVREGGVVRLALDPRHQLVRTRAVEDKLAQALSRFYGEPVRIEIVVAESRPETPAEAEQRASLAAVESARRELEEDEAVRALKERFGATVLPESVRPLK